MTTYLLSALHFHLKITCLKSSLEWSLVSFCLNTRLVGATTPTCFHTVGKMQDPGVARLVFVTVVTLGAEGFCRKLSGLLNQ